MEQNKKLKIAVFTDSFFPGVGGTESAVFHLANALKNLNYDIMVCAPTYYQLTNNDNYNFVVNRCKSKKFPNSVKKVITQRGQFGPYSNGQLNKAMRKYSKGYFTKPGVRYKNYRHSLTAVKKALDGYSTVGQRRYFNGKRYSRPRKNQKIIGNHRFW